MLAAVVPAVTAGGAFAADAPAPAATGSTSYVDEVAIGTALKIAAPGVVEEKKAVVKAADATTAPAQTAQATSTTQASEEPADESTVTATPSDAEVIETDSRQDADDPSEDPTEVAVLGTKIGS